MKKKFLILLVVLMISVNFSGCVDDAQQNKKIEQKSSIDNLKSVLDIMPDDAKSFTYMTVPPSKEYVVTYNGTGLQVHGGGNINVENLTKAYNKKEKNPYTKDNYLGTDFWKNNGYFFTIIHDKRIIGGSSDIKKWIDVTKGKRKSMSNNNDIMEIINMFSGDWDRIVGAVGCDYLYKGCIGTLQAGVRVNKSATGMSVYKFDNDASAKNALEGKIKENMETAKKQFQNISVADIRQDGKFVQITMKGILKYSGPGWY